MKLLKIILPVVIFGLAILLGKQIRSNPPEVNSRPSFSQPQAVEAASLQPQSYQVILTTQGTIEPSVSNTLVAEVAGTIASVSPTFVSGGSFKQGELLIQLDQRDYQIALTQASAQLAQAEAQFQEEAARGKQAKVEWESLNRNRKPTALNLRKPQLAASAANRDAAAAQVERAKLDLLRTQIVAPYDGLVSEAQTNLGQFVSRGSMVGEIYSVKSMDVRLPLTSRQQLLLGRIDTNEDASSNVTLQVSGATWPAKLVRIEGVDTDTQQYNVIARVKIPSSNDLATLRAGQFVQARINGETLDDVYVVPRTAVREGSEVLLLEERKKIQRRPVNVVWRDETNSVIDAGLNQGQILVLTSLPIVANGTPVLATIDGVKPERPKKPSDKKANKGKKQAKAASGNDS
ncbi:MAG: efflux RND transporter periplasmic adaptor subunit [Granulosicoccaceae bacterium]